MAILFASLNLQAAKVAGPDENGRIYNTAYFDVISSGQPPVLDVISYSKRVGSFDWSKFVKQAENSKAQGFKIKISARIEVPSDIKTPKVYVTEGSFYSDLAELNCMSGNGIKCFWSKEPKLKAKRHLSIEIKSFWNDKLQSDQDVLLVKPKSDAFGNRYIDYRLTIELFDDNKFYGNGYMARSYEESLAKIKFKIAPKSRTFQNKWVEPKIYVLDE